METICCFGASVTEQKLGYPVFLKEYLPQYNITHYGYGSHNLGNAGIIYIDNVVNTKPNYCILDFFVVGSSDYINDIEYLNTILYKLSTINCKCIIPFFLCINNNNSGELYYSKIKEYLQKYDIYYIDFNKYLTFTNELIRDDVHTTEFGSKKYAEIISNLIINDNDKIIIPNIKLENKNFLNIQKYKLDNDVYLLENNDFFIELEKPYTYLFIVMIVGPHSGIIKINEVKINTWDIYCHYDRKVTRRCCINNKHITITPTSELFDTFHCKRDIDFTSYEKKLIIKEIYYC